MIKYVAKRSMSAGRVNGKLIVYTKGEAYDEIPKSLHADFEKKEVEIRGKKVETAAKKIKSEKR